MFSTIALVGHNKKFQRYVVKLDQCVEEDVLANRPTKITDAIHWFTFDAMGDFVFSKSFGMLDSRVWHEIVSKLKRGLYPLGPLSPVPWLLNSGLRFGPRVSSLADWDSLNKWCKEAMEERLSTENPDREPDLAYYLMEKGDKSSDQERREWLQGDTLLAILVGR
jgi:tryprostatin B 6-hydroxylase